MFKGDLAQHFKPGDIVTCADKVPGQSYSSSGYVVQVNEHITVRWLDEVDYFDSAIAYATDELELLTSILREEPHG